MQQADELLSGDGLPGWQRVQPGQDTSCPGGQGVIHGKGDSCGLDSQRLEDRECSVMRRLCETLERIARRKIDIPPRPVRGGWVHIVEITAQRMPALLVCDAHYRSPRRSCPIQHPVVVQQSAEAADLLLLIGGNEKTALKQMIGRGKDPYLGSTRVSNRGAMLPTERAVSYGSGRSCRWQLIGPTLAGS